MTGQESPIKLWSSDGQWNADFLVSCLRVLVNSPAASAFLKPTLDGRANFMMEEAVKMAEQVAEGLLRVAADHTGDRGKPHMVILR